MKIRNRMFGIDDFNRWGPFGFSVGIHILALAFLPALLADLSLKNFRDEKPPVMRFVEIVKPPKIDPPKPKAEPEKPALPVPVKREIKAPQPKVAPRTVNDPTPQAASAASEPMAVSRQVAMTSAHALALPAEAPPDIDRRPAMTERLSSPPFAHSPAVTALPKSVPARDIDAPASGNEPSSLKQISRNASLGQTVNQFKPRTVNKSFDGFASVEASQLSAGGNRVLAPFPARPLAPQTVSLEPADRGPADDKDLTGIEDRFASLVREKIAVAKIYPQPARLAGHEGKVTVAFALGRDGRILSLSIDRSSGHDVLDEAALQAVRKANPYPPIPERLGRDSIAFTLPISFTLR